MSVEDVVQAELDGAAERAVQRVGPAMAEAALEAGALAGDSDFIIRPASFDDLGFVQKTWLREYASNGYGWVELVGGADVYFREHAQLRDVAIDRGAVTIACRPSVPSGICGFAVTGMAGRQPLVHFVYVKRRWRRLGVARLLLRPLLEKHVIYTHRTRLVASLPVPDRWTYNPYPFLRLA